MDNLDYIIACVYHNVIESKIVKNVIRCNEHPTKTVETHIQIGLN
jgi:hypothetical protein